jgi:hypothetical protein
MNICKNDIYFIILLLLIIFLFYKVYELSNKKETFTIQDDVKAAISEVYAADVDSIRNLSTIATKLQAGGLTVAGKLSITNDLLVSGKIETNNGLYFKDFDGGLHMTDSDWVRSINNKNIYTGGEIRATRISTEADLNVGGNINITKNINCDTINSKKIQSNGEIQVNQLLVSRNSTIGGILNLQQGQYIDFGSNDTTKDPNAGKIGYSLFEDSLNIVGKGKPNEPRRTKLWDNLSITNKLATNNLDPNNMPDGWTGGIRTVDLYASGTIAIGPDGKNINARINQNGSINVTEIIASGKIHTNEWLRVNGDRGLYFQDFGGGWRMSDTTWIRSYNGKNVYCDAEIRANRISTEANLLTEGSLQVNGNSKVNGQSEIGSNLQVNGNSKVNGQSEIGGSLQVNGNSKVNGQSEIGGNLLLSGANTWMLHTPDDGRKTLYFGKGANGGIDAWPVHFEENGTINCGAIGTGTVNSSTINSDNINANVIKVGSWLLYDSGGRFVIKRNDNAVKYVFHDNKLTANVTQGTNNDRTYTYYVTAMADRQPFHTASNAFANI